MTEISSYTLKPLWNDAEFVRYRGQRETEPRHVLVVAPLSKQPAQGTVRRLEHEYALRTRLDPAWAILPLALVRDDGRTALVLEDPGGEPLSGLLKGPLELTLFLRIAVGLTAALVGLHGRGLIHKDIKPANVMVDPMIHRVWLTGFGIASALPLERQAPEPPETIAGTLAYMAPEQTGRMNRTIDSRSDLYSLGVTLYEMLTGAPPFAASDPLEWVHCHIARKPAPAADRRKDVPKTLSAIVLKLLAKTAEERYQTAAGLGADLRRCLRGWESLGGIDPFLLGAHDASDRLLIPEKLYGRHRESKALLEAFDRVVASGIPELVLVSGYSGIGKSSIVNELHKAFVLPRGIFISGKFDQHKRDIPYATLAQGFETLVRQILSKNDAEIDRWRDGIRDAVGLNGQLVVNLIPELELIIGKQPPVPEVPPQEAQNRFDAVLRAFIGVFGRKEHPLALFLDDLQWLDAATLKLLEHLVTHPDVRYVLLIGAYRDNEVTPDHPLTLTLDSIRRSEAIVVDIVLAPLCFGDVNRLIADSVHQERTSTKALARLVHKKTAGNPFFVIQFLTVLAEERLLEFDPRERTWRWDINRISAKGFTDNLADLMMGKLKRLPVATQKALKQLACFGNSAEITALMRVRGGSEEGMHSDFWDAVHRGFVLRLGRSYKFLHDRVQEATYALIPENERVATHLQIGRLLLSRVASEELEEKIFEIVNQLNRGTELIASSEERERLAELNLIAGKRAKASMAHASALKYLGMGRTLLAEDSRGRQMELTFMIEFHRAECEFVIGNLAAAEERLSMLSRYTRDLTDLAAVTCLRLDLYTTLDRSDRAVEVCLEYLRRLGIVWSPHPTEKEVLQEYERMWRQLGNRPIEALIDLPPMTDPGWRATMDVLAKVMPPALFTDRNLQCLVLGRMANLSLEHGNCDGSCLGYVWLGGVLGTFFGDYRAGFRFGKLSIDLMESHGLNRFKARVYLGFGSLVNFWTQHLRTGLALMRRAFDAAQEIGDLTYATYACYDLIGQLISSGDPLGEVQPEAENALELARKARFGLMVDGITGQLRLIRTLRGLTPKFGSFNDEQFDEVQFEQHLEGDTRLANPACRYWIRKLQARVYASDNASAIEAAAKAELLLWAVPPNVEVTDYHFYAALARAGRYDVAPIGERLQHLEALAAHHKQLVVWAESCPENFGNRAALVAAEIARIDGRELDAERLYEEAIRLAHEHGFIQSEGIANELAGRFYVARGFEVIAHTYFRNARYCYLRWGADGKVKQLERSHPNLRDEPTPLLPPSTIGALAEHLDLISVVKALQAVSREIDLGKLIETLMMIAVEHAGAERGLLFLPHEREHRIAAEATTHDDRVQVMLEHAFVTLPKFPESILRYVIRTRESVILNDASIQNLFSTDEYICRRHSRSILSLPLLKRGDLIGVLYLENSLTPGVFTPDRLAVLELLASQAAISLENARLYADLRRENIERSNAEEALRASEERWRKLFENSSAGIALLGPDSRYRTANLALQKMLGYTEAELQRLDALEVTHEEDLAATEAILADCAEGQRREYRIEKRYRRNDGSVIWADVSTVFVPASGKMSGFFSSVIVDITERKQAEAEARKHREELAHLSRVAIMGELAGSLAHELNQPLTGIVNNASAGRRFIAKGRADLSKLDGIFEDVVEDGRRAAGIIRGIRSMVHKGEEVRGPVNINEVIAGVLRFVHSDALERHCILLAEPDLGLPLVEADQVQLQQVLLNLIVNAFEAMDGQPAAERRVIIRSERESGARVRVSVRDFGPGLPAGETQQIFEQFFSTKRDGMGMGLAIARSIIVSHDGEMVATNAEGGGACVHFSLPGVTKG
jgi:PAS domain S-box-containing protein